jgi:hypothetical protein
VWQLLRVEQIQNGGRCHGNQGAKMLNSNRTADPFSIMLEIKFRPNRWIFVFWRPFLVQDGHHSKPKWLPYGQHVLLPVNILNKFKMVAVAMVTKVQKC